MGCTTYIPTSLKSSIKLYTMEGTKEVTKVLIGQGGRASYAAVKYTAQPLTL